MKLQFTLAMLAALFSHTLYAAAGPETITPTQNGVRVGYSTGSLSASREAVMPAGTTMINMTGFSFSPLDKTALQDVLNALAQEGYRSANRLPVSGNSFRILSGDKAALTPEQLLHVLDQHGKAIEKFRTASGGLLGAPVPLAFDMTGSGRNVLHVYSNVNAVSADGENLLVRYHLGVSYSKPEADLNSRLLLKNTSVVMDIRPDDHGYLIVLTNIRVM